METTFSNSIIELRVFNNTLEIRTTCFPDYKVQRGLIKTKSKSVRVHVTG